MPVKMTIFRRLILMLFLLILPILGCICIPIK